MRRRRYRPSVVAASLGAAVLVGSADARASSAWGDAALTRDDARIEVGPDGVLTVTHTLGLEVTGKRFRAFVIDGVDDGAEPPEGPGVAADRDGPGWLVQIDGAKGERLAGLVEPAKEPRRLRVHLGEAGLARGDWTVHLRYRVDYAKLHLFARDEASLHFTWQAPKWPDGYDAGKITFVLPAALAEPRVGLVDPAGGELGSQAVEEIALVAMQRTPEVDVVELTRPHVAHGDDVSWVVHVDPRALPTVASHLPRPERDTFRVGEEAQGIRAHPTWLLGAPLLALLLGGALALRDRGARRAAAAARTELRPLVALPLVARAALYGLAVAGACVVTTAGHLYVSAALLVAGMALATLRPPLPCDARRPRGRWLAVPVTAIPSPRRPRGSPFDPSTPSGIFLALAGLAGVASAASFVARTHVELAIVGVLHALALVPLALTGRASHLPPSLARDAWPVLAPIAAALRGVGEVNVKAMARLLAAHQAGDGADGGVDEVRLRIDVAEALRATGLQHLEIGCAIVQGTGAATLLPELLIRLRDGAEALARFDDLLDETAGSATFARLAGRDAVERVVVVRPAVTTPRAMRRWVEWALATASGGAPARAAPPLAGSVLAAAASL